MKAPSPYARGPVRIFITVLVLLWGSLIASHAFGFRIIKPHLESAEDRQAYGSSSPYIHK